MRCVACDAAEVSERPERRAAARFPDGRCARRSVKA